MPTQAERPGWERVNVARFETLLRRLLGIKGRAAPELHPELMSSIVLESDRLEFGWLSQTRLVAGAGSEGPVAGQAGQFRIANPAASGWIVVIQEIVCLNLTGPSGFNLKINCADALANAASEGPRDLRWATTPDISVVKITSGTTAAPSGTVIARIGTVGNGASLNEGRFNVPVVLPPGTDIVVQCGVVNNTAQVSFIGYERPYEQSER